MLRQTEMCFRFLPEADRKVRFSRKIRFSRMVSFRTRIVGWQHEREPGPTSVCKNSEAEAARSVQNYLGETLTADRWRQLVVHARPLLCMAFDGAPGVRDARESGRDDDHLEVRVNVSVASGDLDVQCLDLAAAIHGRDPRARSPA